jgi:arylformamidase
VQRRRVVVMRGLVGIVGVLSSGCMDLVYKVGIPIFYEEAALPESRIVRDVAYREGPGADPVKHRLDLFLPELSGKLAPVLVFIHGGGWKTGDKALSPGGYDVYGNIGRYFAARGVATVVTSYRLMPGVKLDDQIDDLAHAVAWVHRNGARYGADPNAIVLSGHSAGGQLAAWLALDRTRLAAVGVPESAVRGLIAVSGAGYDLADEETYRLGADREYYEDRFRNGDPGESWKTKASPIRFVRGDAPPTMVIYAEGETAPLQHQSKIFFEALRRAGAPAQLLAAPAGSHERMVLALSRDDKIAGPAMLAFIRKNAALHPP